jgi:uncharacterized protein (UPF0335 family)
MFCVGVELDLPRKGKNIENKVLRKTFELKKEDLNSRMEKITY